MHIETVKLDQVFDIQRRAATRFSKQHTYFSFECEGVKRYAIQVPGWPRIEQGDALTVVLRQTGNWQTLVGWKNHATGELVHPQPHRSLLGSIEGTVITILMTALFLEASTATGKVAAGLVATMLLLLTLNLLKQYFEQRRIASAIQQLA